MLKATRRVLSPDSVKIPHVSTLALKMTDASVVGKLCSMCPQGVALGAICKSVLGKRSLSLMDLAGRRGGDGVLESNEQQWL